MPLQHPAAPGSPREGGGLRSPALGPPRLQPSGRFDTFMPMARKVYDFSMSHVRARLLDALRRKREGATVADLVAATGLPAVQVQQGIREVADEYDGSLKVTESGEILYHFPGGMRSRKRGTAAAVRRALAAAGKVTGRVLTWVFKAWITVMLVGYFTLFVAIVVFAALASMAMSAAGRNDDRRGGGGMSFYLAVRMFELFMWLWFARGPRAQRSPGRPMRQSVFAYVFGEPDPNAGWDETERRTVVRFLRSQKGLMTAEELMALTGASPREAQQKINRLLLELEGEPEVTDEGTIVYRFENLLRSRAEELRHDAAATRTRKRLVPFNRNEPKRNTWITVFNLVNAAFGTYFATQAIARPELAYVTINGVRRAVVDGSYLYHFVAAGAAALGSPSPETTILIGLGAVPLAFSAVFFAVPLARRLRERAANEAARRENLRRLVYSRVLADPTLVDPRDIRPTAPEETPRNPEAAVERILKELAAEHGGEPVQGPDGSWMWRFPELERERKDVERERLATDTSRYEVGDTVFDSDQ